MSNQDVNAALTKNVVDAELMTNYHDSIIQITLEKKLFDSISSLTKETSLFLGQKLTATQSLKVPAIAENYKDAAILYIESLMNIVKTQDLYSNYNDTINQLEIETLDNLNVEAIKKAQKQYSKFKEYQKAFSKKK